VSSPFLEPERDVAFRIGRAKAGSTQYFVVPGANLYQTGTLTVASGTDYYCPFYLQSAMVVDQLVFDVATLSAGNARAGIYAADTDWQPSGAPLADSGDISVNTTGLKTYTPGTPVALRRGRYLTVFNSSVTPTLNTDLGSMPGLSAVQSSGLGSSPFQAEWRVARAYAAFPTPGTAWTTTTGFGTSALRWLVALRVLAA
jgi:hypothetical protein